MKRESKVFRTANFVMTLAFFLSVAVQYNDPDPIQWMAVYGAAGICCVVYARGRLPWLAPVVIAAIALAWAGFLAPRVVGQVSLSQMFESVGMDTIAIEEGREMLGLAIVAAWMIPLALAARKQSPAVRPSS